LRIIKIFKNAKKKALSENINNDKFKDFKIQKFINDNEKNTNADENADINENDDDNINILNSFT
jgi:hypothetical protein